MCPVKINLQGGGGNDDDDDFAVTFSCRSKRWDCLSCGDEKMEKPAWGFPVRARHPLHSRDGGIVAPEKASGNNFILGTYSPDVPYCRNNLGF
jgi:hypothetical protein